MRWAEYIIKTGCRQTKENYRKWIELECGINPENLKKDIDSARKRIELYGKYIDTDSFRNKMIQIEEKKIMECKRRMNTLYGKLV